jgi:5'-phosphate synthase pdxT subunit
MASQAMPDQPLIGVLALQGAFRDHVHALEDAGARTRLVRLPEDLQGLDGLVIPGGESTTMTLLLERMNLLGPVRAVIAAGLPTLATCAGLILLAREISDGVDGQRGLDLMDLSVRRNGYGRQVHSFEADLEIEGLEGGPFPGVFIRSPLVERVGAAEVIARHAGRPVGLRQGNMLGLCFHPELSGDRRLHSLFVSMAAGHPCRS